MNESTQRLCAVCSDPVDPDEAHWPHEPDCGNGLQVPPPCEPCNCDLFVHPECCPELDCQDITNGHTIELTARLWVPRWFAADQVNKLAAELCEFLAQNGRPNLDGFIPDAETTYEDSYGGPYVCAAQAETAVDSGEGEGETAGTPLVVWGHGVRCRACHHLQEDHDPDTYGCLVDGCDCPGWLPYGRLAEIGEARS